MEVFCEEKEHSPCSDLKTKSLRAYVKMIQKFLCHIEGSFNLGTDVFLYIPLSALVSLNFLSRMFSLMYWMHFECPTLFTYYIARLVVYLRVLNSSISYVLLSIYIHVYFSNDNGNRNKFSWCSKPEWFLTSEVGFFLSFSVLSLYWCSMALLICCK